MAEPPIPWEQTADNQSARLRIGRRRPGGQQKYIALDAMYSLSRLSAEFRGVPLGFELNTRVLVACDDQADFVGVYDYNVAVAQPTAHLPRWCLRRVRWRPREMPGDPAYPPETGIFEGFRALKSEILFLPVSESWVPQLIEETALCCRSGLCVRAVSRPSHPYAELRIGLIDESTTYEFCYAPRRSENADLEDIISRWLERAFAISPATTVPPDKGHGCRVSYPFSVNERILAP